MQPLADITAEAGLPTPYDDATMLRAYQEAGGDLQRIIYLSLGETWDQAAEGLRAALAREVPAHAHGYILSPYGLPALHRVLRAYIAASHHLDGVAVLGRDYEVAVSQNSTRNGMFHFGRLLLEEARTGGGRPVAVASSPGWDYSGVFGALGYEMRRFAVRPEDGYQPDAHEVAGLLRRAREEGADPLLLIINAQHNPTGANWAARTVRAMVHAALEAGACLLVDDAYYAVHDPGIVPTNSLRLLLESLAVREGGAHPRWLAVRSLGKQFHSNGWGIGALTAAPGTMTRLAVDLLPQYTYASAVPLQAAMAAWLEDPDSDRYLTAKRAEYAEKRAYVTRRLVAELGYPKDALFPGECAVYLLMRIPPWFEGSDWRRHCLDVSGVFLGEAHMTTPGHALNEAQGHVRLYLGPPLNILAEALDRMRDSGLTWQGA